MASITNGCITRNIWIARKHWRTYNIGAVCNQLAGIWHLKFMLYNSASGIFHKRLHHKKHLNRTKHWRPYNIGAVCNQLAGIWHLNFVVRFDTWPLYSWHFKQCYYRKRFSKFMFLEFNKIRNLQSQAWSWRERLHSIRKLLVNFDESIKKHSRRALTALTFEDPDVLDLLQHLRRFRNFSSEHYEAKTN